MNHPSISAYDAPERVAEYDRDMEIMHPLRSRMIEVALEVLPFHQDERLMAVDLGAGTGFFTQQFLKAYPKARIAAVDGAESMVALARGRLGAVERQVEFTVADFRHLDEAFAQPETIDVVFTSYALHHLEWGEKSEVITRAVHWLRYGGWFVNADLVVARSAEVEDRIQELRVEGVVSRARAGDPRFRDADKARSFLDELEENEQDRPLPLEEDLEIARRAGLENVEVFWKEYREAVWGGPK